MKGRVGLSSLLEDEERVVGLESTDEHECVEPVSLEGSGNLSEVDVRESSVGSKLRSTSSGPPIDSEPVELRDVVGEKTVEAVVDGEGGVASRETVSDGLSSGSVHSSGGSTNAEGE